MKARLTIEEGDARPELLELEQAHAASMGRSRDNSIVLRSEHASRLHAKVLFEAGRWQVEDFSLNGTYLNGMRVQQREDLEHGQEIRIGEICLRFTLDEPQAGSSIGLRSTTIERKERPSSSGSISTSRLQASEMAVLCSFMAAHVADDDPLLLLREALKLFLTQSGAFSTGYLSPDPADPLPKVVQPEAAGFDHVFSRHMTRKALRDGKSVWLATELSDSRPTDSLREISDALCVPVRSSGVALGMLHAVKKGDLFAERDVRFAEAMADFLGGCLRGLQARRNLELETARLRAHPPTVDDLIGDSAAMVRLRQQMAKIAPQPVPVLIRGEPGVGLEIVALLLHRQSPRVNGPFVAAPCSTTAPALLEADLFGPRPDSVGGEPQPGYCFLADDGSLFLDEIAALSQDAQARLLRLIEDKCFRPTGSSLEFRIDVRADVRVIAATQLNLEKLVARNQFRQPLLDKLSQAVIEVPPLRTHLEDIPFLAQYFLDKLALETRRQVILTDAAMRKLTSYVWPGNHRQLRAELEAAALRAPRDAIDEDDVLIGCEQFLMAKR